MVWSSHALLTHNNTQAHIGCRGTPCLGKEWMGTRRRRARPRAASPAGRLRHPAAQRPAGAVYATLLPCLDVVVEGSREAAIHKMTCKLQPGGSNRPSPAAASNPASTQPRHTTHCCDAPHCTALRSMLRPLPAGRQLAGQACWGPWEAHTRNDGRPLARRRRLPPLPAQPSWAAKPPAGRLRERQPKGGGSSPHDQRQAQNNSRQHDTRLRTPHPRIDPSMRTSHLLGTPSLDKLHAVPDDHFPEGKGLWCQRLDGGDLKGTQGGGGGGGQTSMSMHGGGGGFSR